MVLPPERLNHRLNEPVRAAAAAAAAVTDADAKPTVLQQLGLPTPNQMNGDLDAVGAVRLEAGPHRSMLYGLPSRESLWSVASVLW